MTEQITKIFSPKTILEVLAGITINLTSGWFGVVLITPGVLGVANPIQYALILTQNLAFGIFGLSLSLWLTERGKKL